MPVFIVVMVTQFFKRARFGVGPQNKQKGKLGTWISKNKSHVKYEKKKF